MKHDQYSVLSIKYDLSDSYSPYQQLPKVLKPTRGRSIIMNWSLAQEEYSYYIYDENVKAIGYFNPDFGTSAEDRIIDMITDEAHIKGGKLTLYFQQLPSEALSLEKFVAWAQSVLRKLSMWEKYQQERKMSEPQIGLGHGILSVIIEVKFEQPAGLTKEGLTQALDGVLADLRNRQMI
jgi:hypothetical protein